MAHQYIESVCDIHQWVVVARDHRYWLNDGLCGEDFFRTDLTPFVIGDRARVIDQDEDGCDNIESRDDILERLIDGAVAEANLRWGADNWTELEFCEPVWHKTTRNSPRLVRVRREQGDGIESDLALSVDPPYPITQYRYSRDWEAEQQAERDRQMDPWF